MIYWLTETVGSSVSMYREENKMTHGTDSNAKSSNGPKSKVPVAIALFPDDIEFPREWAEQQGLNIKRFPKFPKGGHFAALDVPKVYAQDLQNFFAEISSVDV
jgi:hypothetical protein